jgi:hypothetical protein
MLMVKYLIVIGLKIESTVNLTMTLSLKFLMAFLRISLILAEFAKTKKFCRKRTRKS